MIYNRGVCSERGAVRAGVISKANSRYVVVFSSFLLIDLEHKQVFCTRRELLLTFYKHNFFPRYIQI